MKNRIPSFLFMISLFLGTLVQATDPGAHAGKTFSRDDMWLDQACGGVKAQTANAKKFNDCKEWQKLEDKAEFKDADSRCGGSKTSNMNPAAFQKCAKVESEKARKERLLIEDRCGGYDAYLADKAEFKKCKEKK